MTNRTIYFNEDNHHFFAHHPPEDMSVEGAYRLVDEYVIDTQVAGILFCVNVQRALFDSKVWETFWDGYDPVLGENQPTIQRRHGVKNHLLLRQRGVDLHAAWLERCRHHGIEGWLTMRMNDCHGLCEYVANEQAGFPDQTSWMVNWPTTFWKLNPQLRRAPYRKERSWEGAFDYSKQEVRDHHLNLIRELLERYDMFGLELDWMRWGMYFAPGHEAAGSPILTDFVRQVRTLADLAQKRLGHPVKLAHRLPADPQSCLAMGFDPITWSREQLADMVTLSPFCGGANFAYDAAIWRSMLTEDVKLLGVADADAYPTPGRRIEEYEFLYGAAASALHRGLDGVYLFNQNYRQSGEPQLLAHMLRHLGDLKTLAACQRRHALTYVQFNSPGMAAGNLLPIPLRLPLVGVDLGRLEQNITLRIPIGPRPKQGCAVLCLGFDTSVPAWACDALTVRLNTVLVNACEEPTYTSISSTFCPERHGWGSDGDFPGHIRFFDLPLDLLHDDVNVIEMIPPQVDGNLQWAEILLLPERH
jgi:hypothetical protein